MSLPEYMYPQAAEGGDPNAKIAQKAFADPNYAAQLKLDGARYIIQKDLKGRVSIYSRHLSATNGKPVDKTMQLFHLAEMFNKTLPRGTVFDGEVVAPGESTFNLVTKVTGAKPDKAFQTQEREGFLEYRAFDCLAIGGDYIGDKPYRERHESLIEANRCERYIHTQALVTGTEEQKRLFYETVVARGGEGILLKDVRAPYHQGKRDSSWVKVKAQKSFDVVFMGIELAEELTLKKGDTELTASRIAGQAGAIKFGQYVRDGDNAKPLTRLAGSMFPQLEVDPNAPTYSLRLLGTVSGFDDATRFDITANCDEYVDTKRVFEITAQKQFPKGTFQSPRFKQWRDDKSPADCVFRKDEG